LKKPAGSVRFYKQKTKKTKPNRIKTRKKPSQNQKKPSQNRENRAKPENWAKPVWTGSCPKKPNRTETGQFDPVSVQFCFFKKKKLVWLFFLYKNRTEQKMITPITKYRGRFNFLYLYLLVNCHHKKKDYWLWSHILIFMYFNDNN